VRDGTVSCLIGLGGNTGPVEQTFVHALEQLEDAGCCIVSRSSCHLSVSMGSDAGSDFVNAAAVLSTQRSPLELLDLLQEVEQACGRVRTVPWGPRTLDLDLLSYGQQLIQTECLTVPHPGLWYRRFVLDPLVEIASEWIHPGNGQTIRVLRARLDQRPLIVEIDGMAELPVVPGHYADGTVELRDNGGALSPLDTVQPHFCRLSVCSDAEQRSAVSETAIGDFELSAPMEQLQELTVAVLIAALGY